MLNECVSDLPARVRKPRRKERLAELGSSVTMRRLKDGNDTQDIGWFIADGLNTE